MVRLRKENKTYKNDIHRLVAITFLTNPENKKCVDHIDNNRQNNNLINLRFATHSQNSQNQPMSKRNKSGTKGVCWNKKTNKWTAQKTIDGKKIILVLIKKGMMQLTLDEYGEFINKCELVIT